MSEFKGTKGKWVNNDGEISGWNGEYICDCHVLSKIDSYNVLLILKAPEMLDMLERMIKEFDVEFINQYQFDLHQQAKYLIKSATEL